MPTPPSFQDSEQTLLYKIANKFSTAAEQGQHIHDYTHMIAVGVDGSVIPDAPSDGDTYGRKDGEWSDISLSSISDMSADARTRNTKTDEELRPILGIGVSSEFRSTVAKISNSAAWNGWAQGKAWVYDGVIYVIYCEQFPVWLMSSSRDGVQWSAPVIVQNGGTNTAMFAAGADSDGTFWAAVEVRGVDTLIANKTIKIIKSTDLGRIWVDVVTSLTFDDGTYKPDELHGFCELPNGNLAMGYSFVTGKYGVLQFAKTITQGDQSSLVTKDFAASQSPYVHSEICFYVDGSTVVGTVRSESLPVAPKFFKTTDNFANVTLTDAPNLGIITGCNVPITKTPTGEKYLCLYSERDADSAKVYLATAPVATALSAGGSAFTVSECGQIIGNNSGIGQHTAAGNGALVTLGDKVVWIVSSSEGFSTRERGGMYSIVLDYSSTAARIVSTADIQKNVWKGIPRERCVVGGAVKIMSPNSDYVATGTGTARFNLPYADGSIVGDRCRIAVASSLGIRIGGGTGQNLIFPDGQVYEVATKEYYLDSADKPNIELTCVSDDGLNWLVSGGIRKIFGSTSPGGMWLTTLVPLSTANSNGSVGTAYTGYTLIRANNVNSAYAVARFLFNGFSTNGTTIAFNKPGKLGILTNLNSSLYRAGNCRFFLGSDSGYTVGDFATKGLGWRITADTVYAAMHDGTSYSEPGSDTTVIYSNSMNLWLWMEWDGKGNVIWSVASGMGGSAKKAIVATTSSMSTTATAAGYSYFSASAQNGASSPAYQQDINLTGIYLEQ